ncbi:hypothetical protein BD626DRAFT_621661 [Schizophyllum amplum]|uniref:Uncharacterized protein n=1 Tax=Schizophyllum amplum TaxID=97359 RepID=A0A550BTM6_9AGAR|nr:hypothetical protein BD626DRAFT_621661 [Auriculariopsis ampla]
MTAFTQSRNAGLSGVLTSASSVRASALPASPACLAAIVQVALDVDDLEATKTPGSGSAGDIPATVPVTPTKKAKPCAALDTAAVDPDSGLKLANFDCLPDSTKAQISGTSLFGPDWRHCSLIAMVAGSKVAFKKQTSIRYTSFGTVEKVMSMTGGNFYEHHTQLYMNLSAPSSIPVCGNLGNSNDRITFSLLQRLLTRHGQRCAKSRLGLVMRFGCNDITHRPSAFSNIGESFVYPPTIAVFVEERFVAGIRERYEKEDLNYMAAIKFAVASGRPFEFAAFKRELAKLSKDLPIDETAEPRERIRVIESFNARPGAPADAATMFTRELTVLDVRDPGICEDIRQALADLVARK